MGSASRITHVWQLFLPWGDVQVHRDWLLALGCWVDDFDEQEQDHIRSIHSVVFVTTHTEDQEIMLHLRYQNRLHKLW